MRYGVSRGGGQRVAPPHSLCDGCIGAGFLLMNLREYSFHESRIKAAKHIAYHRLKDQWERDKPPDPSQPVCARNFCLVCIRWSGKKPSLFIRITRSSGTS
ncbi:hypothetical protein E2C01_056037 [Portunus trituberculatus]|uniref:Uncharacterized protein n=1 Tax=Portunus trituberculatus TaxID=210409 RepID=A0A5B7GYJ9_PORTR|nr:hypothetical protein [Portunus trituberculatus]